MTMDQQVSERSALRLTGGLLAGGFLAYIVATMFHPSGSEDNHEEIFAEYADSGPWEAVHLGQFFGVIIIIAGLLVLYRTLMARGMSPFLGPLAAASAVVTAASFAILQGLDGVALKQATEAWVDASGAQEQIRFADAETVRWLEWGFQSYFRVMLGVTLILFGAVLVVSLLVPRWLGWVAILGGLLSIANGIDVGYSGLESGFQDATIGLSQLAILIFVVGVLVVGIRREPTR